MTPPPGLPRPPADRLYLGWQYATPHPDPGPPPRRPVPPEREQLSATWLAAQQREENLISRPLRIGTAVAVAVVLALLITVVGGWVPVVIAAPAIAACLLAGGLSGYAIWQGKRALGVRVAAERHRVEQFRADQESRLFAWQAEHARQVSEWQRHRFAYDNQKRWFAASLPAGMDRVDVAGGTLAGWSALVTMVAAHRLAAGGEVTVVDLSGGAIAADLVAVARGLASAQAAQGVRSDLNPAVWVLPHDLPRLDLTASLGPDELADVLALAVSVAEDKGAPSSLAVDSSIIERVMGVLDRGDGVSVARLAAGLRALGQVGDVRTDISAGLLTEQEAGQIGTLFGQGASDRVVLERALGIESQLRKLVGTGQEPGGLARSRLRVVALDKRVGVLSAKILGSFVITALTHLLSQAPPGRAWQHTLFLFGAERLRDDVLDRLTDACETARSGLVLGYRSIPPQVRQRIGRGNAAVAFMRLGNAEDAKAASEQIGTEHRFVLSQLTETIGTSVTDTTGVSYTGTVGESASIAASRSGTESVSRGRGRSRARSAGSSFLPLADVSRTSSSEKSTSRGISDSESLTAGISTSSAWGVSTSLAAGDNESLAQSLQRSREFVVEASELQRLPPTAMIVSYPSVAGRTVFLADANPAIGSLTAATMTPLAEAGTFRASAPEEQPAPDGAAPAGPSRPQPNLGPPSARLDWRKR
ncbi:MAG TPA: hypothetical protein VNV62_04150 [Trebonia sp.]|jgi:hypothetical protein|nr:hypothetical protein [Trebonia sp.]